jgi:mutator protein MutT
LAASRRLLLFFKPGSMYTDINPSVVFGFCPRCGSSQFRTMGSRAKKCENCYFTYYFNASAAVAALIFDEKGRLLLTRRAVEPHIGMLDLPGGFIEPMESAEEAVSRELKEELGVEVISMEYLCSFPNEYPFSGLSVSTLDMAFCVKVKSLNGMNPMDDISAFEFYFPDEVPLNEISATSVKNIIERIKQEDRKI